MPAVDVDTALLTIGYGFAQVIIFVVSFFTYMYSVSESMSVSYIVVLTSCEFATTKEEKTLLADSLLGGMVVSGLFIGFLADKYGRKYILRLALIGALGFSSISALMPELYSLSVLRMIVGLFLSGVSSLQVGFLTEFHAPQWRPLVVTLCSQSVSTALIYCPLMTMAIQPHSISVNITSDYHMRGWRFLMMIVQIPGWIALLGICLVPETPHFYMSVRRDQEATEVLKWICRMNRKNLEDLDIFLTEDPRATIISKEGFFRNMLYEMTRLFRKPYVGTFMICLMVIFGLFFTSIGMGIWFPIIRNMDNSGSHRLCDLVENNPIFHAPPIINGTEAGPPSCHDEMTNLIDPIYYGLAYMGCFFLSSLLLQCLIRKNVITLHIAVAFVLGISLNFLKQPTLVLVCFTGMMVMPGVLIPLASSVLIDALPIHLRGKALCMVRSLARLGAVGGSTLVGLLIRVSCDTTLNLFNVYLAVCVILAIFLPK
ncbi:putative transporter SVOPL isoform X1 [Drosophila rhopaloa]|uniref:Major facilitator superfamily (MFS) profile domain-containing protein n=1 Tax=Drosophila rhopaloa TaxID=1041015 RepID=A0ABM5I869_DRORH|nr:putative transporter SVOPL isoform X1 [Drosophila rhopaloa]